MRRTALMFALAGMVGALVATPIAVYATHQFTDVSDGAFFSNSVTWMKDNGITVGCNPPANTKYCPNDNVSRGEMAVFLKRLAEKKVVDAATAVNATNASALGGLTAAELAPRAAFNSTNNAPDGAPFTLSTTITAPAPGILLISGGIEAFSGGSSESYDCLLAVDGGEVPGTDRVSRVDSGVGSNTEEDCSTTGAIAVDAGTYAIDLEVIGVDATINLTHASVWVLWVPFDGSGAIPTSFSQLGQTSPSIDERLTD